VETGLPLLVRMEEGGELLRLLPDGTGWAGVEPLDLERLEERGYGAPLPYPRSHCRGSLDWFRVAEYAQRQTDRLREAGTLPGSWELRLPRDHKGRRHTFPRRDHRLVLARARRKRPRPPRLRLDRVYVAVDGSAFRRWLLFLPDGVMTHMSHFSHDPVTVHTRLGRPGSADHRGEWSQEGRDLVGWVGRGGGPFRWQGFLGDDGGLYLRSSSRITGHQAANVWRVARPKRG